MSRPDGFVSVPDGEVQAGVSTGPLLVSGVLMTVGLLLGIVTIPLIPLVFLLMRDLLSQRHYRRCVLISAGFFAGSALVFLNFLWHIYIDTQTYSFFVLGPFFAALITAPTIPILIVLRFDHHARLAFHLNDHPTLCPNCYYDLFGLTPVVTDCPECNAPILARQRRRLTNTFRHPT